MTMLVQNVLERDKMRELIAKDGMLVPCQGRTRTPHPLIKALRELEAQISGAAGRLGFDPASRAKLGIVLAGDPSRLDAMMTRQREDGLALRRKPS